MKLTITELKRLINEEVSKINKSSTKRSRRNKMLQENRRVREIIRLFEMKESEVTDPQVKRDIDKLIAALNAGKLEAVVKALNSEGLKTQQGTDFLKAGDLDKDKVTVDANKEGQECKKMLPTQSQIFCLKSTSYPCSLWNTVVAASQGKFHGGISVASTPGGQQLILDGHHRWSGAMSMSNDAKFKATVYTFVGLSQEEILSRLQVGIATKRQVGADLPKAGGDTLDAEDAGEPVEKTADGGGDPDDILGRNAAFIEDRMSTVTGQQNTDPKLIEKGGDTLFLGDDYFKDMKEAPVAGALALIGLTEADLGRELPVAQCTGNGLSCPVRSKIIKKIALNLSKLPSNDSAPERKYMPQLDHEEIGGKATKAALETEFAAGSINHEVPFFKPEDQATTTESVDLKRWHKLAGILKD